jgi:hypothetical protein
MVETGLPSFSNCSAQYCTAIRTDGSCLMLASTTGLLTALVTTRQVGTCLQKSGLFAGFLRDAVTWSCWQHRDRR